MTIALLVSEFQHVLFIFEEVAPLESDIWTFFWAFVKKIFEKNVGRPFFSRLENGSNFAKFAPFWAFLALDDTMVTAQYPCVFMV